MPETKKKKSRAVIIKTLAVLLLIFFCLLFLAKPNLSSKPQAKWLPHRWRNWSVPKPWMSKSEVFLCQDVIVENWYSYHRCILVNFSVSAKASPGKRDQLAAVKAEHDAEIKDRVRSIVGSLDPEDIQDPHLKVAKQEIKTTLTQIAGADLIEEILFPQWHFYLLDQAGIAAHKQNTDQVLASRTSSPSGS